MRPTWSIILFTVLSGAGFGMAVVLTVVASTLSVNAVVIAATIAVLLIIAGLLSSTGHLANPKNAWRALFRLRSSWLSREAALALLFFPLFAGWLFAVVNQYAAVLLAVFVTAVAVATVFCTAMIYASLKPVPLWRHPLTPINYLLFAATTGLLLVALVAGVDSGKTSSSLTLTLVLILLLAAAGKAAQWRRVTAAVTTAPAATGLQVARVRLLDAGHTGPNFLTREFVYTAPPVKIATAKKVAVVAGFVAPLASALAALVTMRHELLFFALPLMTAGLLAERWLFFAEARHVVRLYHGDEKV